jgi:hypothetical protein
MDNILDYIKEQLQLTKDLQTYTDWEETRKDGAISALEDLLEQFSKVNTEGAQTKIELLYNGDYPGYPCVRVNDKWLDSKEEVSLCKFFNVNDLKELYDKVGLSKDWDGTISEEHKPFEGTLSIHK